MERSLVVYRCPDGGDRCFMAEYDDADVKQSYSYDDVGNESCFVFAPFSLTEHNASTPVIRFCNKKFKACTLQNLRKEASAYSCSNLEKDKGLNHGQFSISESIEWHDRYKNDFSSFHAAASSGKVKKIVLARSMRINYTGCPDIIELYVKACKNNPGAFVALVSNTACGTWLIATPEVLLEHEAGRFHTMSLAGTMKLNGEIQESLTHGCDVSEIWSKKNIEEQQIVSSYIKETLKNFSDDIIMVGPRSVVAGNVIHLRSDFNFTAVRPDVAISDILQALHPTPAVCGMPVEESKKIISCEEHVDRKYYSGFCGPIDINLGTRLFVTLRCMQIHEQYFELFAGGGILPESTEADEWNETLYKMQTMMKSIGL